MRKTLLSLALVAVVVVCAVFGLAACNETPKGDAVFNEGMSLSDIVAALEKADNFSIEVRTTTSEDSVEGVYSGETIRVTQVAKNAVYESTKAEYRGEVSPSDISVFVSDGVVYEISRSNQVYVEGEGYVVIDGVAVSKAEKNLLSNSDPVADEYIAMIYEYLAEEDGKVVPHPNLQRRFDDPYVRFEGDKLVVGWSHQYSNNMGTYRNSSEYVWCMVNATSVYIPDEAKEAAADAEWAEYLSFGGVHYNKGGSGEDEYYYVLYKDDDALVPVESINGLPVREEGEDPDDPDVELVSYSADSSACRGIITGTLTFVSEKHWIMYIGGSAADMSKNDNWCRGEYYFEGDEGRSLLHISLYGPEDYYFEEFGADEMYNQNDPAYDPSSARLVGNDGEPVEAYGEEVVIAPDANGSYVIRVTVYGVMDQIFNAGGTKEDGWFEFVFDTRGGNKF